MKDGFIKVAAASPMIKVADAEYNAGKVIECMKKAADKGVKVLVFPELTLTGCSCYDLVGHSVILRGAERALEKVIEASAGSDMLVIVGLPYAPRGGAGGTGCGDRSQAPGTRGRRHRASLWGWR